MISSRQKVTPVDQVGDVIESEILYLVVEIVNKRNTVDYWVEFSNRKDIVPTQVGIWDEIRVD